MAKTGEYDWPREGRLLLIVADGVPADIDAAEKWCTTKERYEALCTVFDSVPVERDRSHLTWAVRIHAIQQLMGCARSGRSGSSRATVKR